MSSYMYPPIANDLSNTDIIEGGGLGDVFYPPPPIPLQVRDNHESKQQSLRCEVMRSRFSLATVHIFGNLWSLADSNNKLSLVVSLPFSCCELPKRSRMECVCVDIWGWKRTHNTHQSWHLQLRKPLVVPLVVSDLLRNHWWHNYWFPN